MSNTVIGDDNCDLLIVKSQKIAPKEFLQELELTT